MGNHTGAGLRRILVVKRDKLGDMLLTTPLLAHLKRSLPECEVHVLASDYCGWVVRDCADVASLVTYPRLRAGSLLRPFELLRYARALVHVRRMRVDVAIMAGGEYSRRGIERALSARAARTIAYAPADHPFGAQLTDPLPPPTAEHEMDRMLALAAPLGIAPPREPIWPEYRLPQAAQSFALGWLGERRLATGGYIVLGLGARRPARQPIVEQILRWTARWRDERGLQTVFMWTPGKSHDPLYPGDDVTAAPVVAAAQAARPDIHLFRGPIIEALGLIWNARTSVFPDSGLMHFAAASPGGVVGLFPGLRGGPGAGQWAPRGPHARWLQGESRVAEIADDALFAQLGELLDHA